MLMTCLVRMASSIRVGEQAQDHCRLAARDLAMSDVRGTNRPRCVGVGVRCLAFCLALCSQALVVILVLMPCTSAYVMCVIR